MNTPDEGYPAQLLHVLGERPMEVGNWLAHGVLALVSSTNSSSTWSTQLGLLDNLDILTLKKLFRWPRRWSEPRHEQMVAGQQGDAITLPDKGLSQLQGGKTSANHDQPFGDGVKT